MSSLSSENKCFYEQIIAKYPLYIKLVW